MKLFSVVCTPIDVLQIRRDCLERSNRLDDASQVELRGALSRKANLLSQDVRLLSSRHSLSADSWGTKRWISSLNLFQ